MSPEPQVTGCLVGKGVGGCTTCRVVLLEVAGWYFGDLGGGFKCFFFIFTPKPGEIIQFDEHVFQMGWFNRHLVIGWFSFFLTWILFVKYMFNSNFPLFLKKPRVFFFNGCGSGSIWLFFSRALRKNGVEQPCSDPLVTSCSIS